MWLNSSGVRNSAAYVKPLHNFVKANFTDGNVRCSLTELVSFDHRSFFFGGRRGQQKRTIINNVIQSLTEESEKLRLCSEDSAKPQLFRFEHNAQLSSTR
jgi:hypothetical protein